MEDAAPPVQRPSLFDFNKQKRELLLVPDLPAPRN